MACKTLAKLPALYSAVHQVLEGTDGAQLLSSSICDARLVERQPWPRRNSEGEKQSSYSSEGEASCTPCAAGFSSSAGAERCTKCPAGTAKPAGAGDCAPCEKGSFAEAGSDVCKAAEPGYYVDKPRAARQKPCRPGIFASGSGNVKCSDCSPGAYATSAAAT